MRRRYIGVKGLTSFDVNNYLTMEALEDNLSVSFMQEIEYGIDGIGWRTLSAGVLSPSINTGHTISFRGNLTHGVGGIGTFTISKKCNLKGNCMSLLFGDNAADNYSLSGKNSVFYNLFKNCSNIVTVSSNFLPATTLAYNCYGCMFQFCTSLVNAPELPATKLANQCYNYMFQSCTSLTTAPELLATTLANYCYNGMFNGCYKLNYIKMLATDISASNCLSNWVSGVASTGTFVKHPAMGLPIATSSNNYVGIPRGWTVMNDGEESGGKIENKLSYSIGRLDKVTFTFQYPVESDVAIYFIDVSSVEYGAMETISPATITKGNNTAATQNANIDENDTITITRIVPNEDDKYIYTW